MRDMWCPSSDSNREPSASKAAATANCARGAGLVEQAGFEPTRNETTSGLQPGALPNRRLLRYGGQSGIRTRSDQLLRLTCLPITPTARRTYRSRYRKVVCAAGFEPATPRFQGANSDQTELRTVVLGRGGEVFMGENIT